jgi:hypothetical protein
MQTFKMVQLQVHITNTYTLNTSEERERELSLILLSLNLSGHYNTQQVRAKLLILNQVLWETYSLIIAAFNVNTFT